MKVYIAGPYTDGDIAVNVRRAIDAAEKIAQLGHIPFVPHLCHFWHMIYPHAKEFWLNIDLAMLPLFDVLFVIDYNSAGVKLEVAEAAKRHIPIITTIGRLLTLEGDLR